MKISKATAFKPVTITLETKAELICMRAIADSAHFGRKISETFISQRYESPLAHDAEDFARVLDQRLADEEYN